MPHESHLWRFRLKDILDAIARIESYASGLSYEEFVSDRKTLDAVERNFILIGEAVRGIPDEIQRHYSHIPWEEMRAMRNFVVHVYWSVDARRVWDTIHNNLPPLVSDIERMVQETAPEGQ